METLPVFRIPYPENFPILYTTLLKSINATYFSSVGEKLTNGYSVVLRSNT